MKDTLNPGFGTQKKGPFPLNKGVPSTEVTDTKIMWINILSQGVPKDRGGGGAWYFKNSGVGMWDPGTLNLYQS